MAIKLTLFAIAVDVCCGGAFRGFCGDLSSFGGDSHAFCGDYSKFTGDSHAFCGDSTKAHRKPQPLGVLSDSRFKLLKKPKY